MNQNIKKYTGIRIRKNLGDTLVEYTLIDKNAKKVKVVTTNNKLVEALYNKGALHNAKKSWDKTGVYSISNPDAYGYLDMFKNIPGVIISY